MSIQLGLEYRAENSPSPRPAAAAIAGGIHLVAIIHDRFAFPNQYRTSCTTRPETALLNLLIDKVTSTVCTSDKVQPLSVIGEGGDGIFILSVEAFSITVKTSIHTMYMCAKTKDGLDKGPSLQHPSLYSEMQNTPQGPHESEPPCMTTRVCDL